MGIQKSNIQKKSIQLMSATADITIEETNLQPSEHVQFSYPPNPHPRTSSGRPFVDHHWGFGELLPAILIEIEMRVILG